MEFVDMLQKDLMILARERNIKGRSKMRKSDLVESLHQDEVERKEVRQTGREGKKMAKQERKAQLKETRKERKRVEKEVKEGKEMRTASEKKTISQQANQRRKRRPQESGKEPTAKLQSRSKRSSPRDLREIRVTPQSKRRSQRSAAPTAGLSAHHTPRSTTWVSAFTPEAVQTRSALKGFARQHVFEGLDGVGPREFLEMHEDAITDILD